MILMTFYLIVYSHCQLMVYALQIVVTFMTSQIFSTHPEIALGNTSTVREIILKGGIKLAIFEYF